MRGIYRKVVILDVLFTLTELPTSTFPSGEPVIEGVLSRGEHLTAIAIAQAAFLQEPGCGLYPTNHSSGL